MFSVIPASVQRALVGLCLSVAALCWFGGCNKPPAKKKTATEGNRATELNPFRDWDGLAEQPLAGLRWGVSRSTLQSLRSAAKAVVAPIYSEPCRGLHGLERVHYVLLKNKGLYLVKWDFKSEMAAVVATGTQRWGEPQKSAWRKRTVYVWQNAAAKLRIRLLPHLFRKDLVRLTVERTDMVP